MASLHSTASDRDYSSKFLVSLSLGSQVTSSLVKPSSSSVPGTSLQMQGDFWVAVHETTKDFWLLPSEGSSEKPVHTIEYHPTDEPLRFNVKVWPSSYPKWDNTSGYAQSVNCILSGVSTAAKLYLNFQHTSPFWQWCDTQPAWLGNGLTMSCLNYAPDLPLPDNSLEVGPDPHGTDCHNTTIDLQVGPADGDHQNWVKLQVENVVGAPHTQDWTHNVTLMTGGLEFAQVPHQCTDPYLHFTYWRYNNEKDLQQEAYYTYSEDCILTGSPNDVTVISLEWYRFDWSPYVFNGTCTAGGPSPID